MRLTIGCLAVACLLLAGCGQSGGGTVSPSPGTSRDGSPSGTGGSSNGPGGSVVPSPVADGRVPLSSGAAALGPQNTLIQFVGTHVGDRPDPRTGNFQSFSGTAQLNDDGQTLKSVSVDIETASLVTPIGQLTGHLNSQDFFDTREYPKAKFQSKSITAPDADGNITVTGDLTLLQTTKEIAFPATVSVNDDGLSLKAQFDIDRTEFGMDRLQERVENVVAMTVVIGQKTEPMPASGPGPGGGTRGGGPGQGGRRGPGGFDPGAFFTQRDADSDGKLSGDEIPELMRQDIEAIDTDGDGAISREEFDARMRSFRPPGGGRGPGGDQPEDGKSAAEKRPTNDE